MNYSYYFRKKAIEEATKYKKLPSRLINKIYDNEAYHYIEGVDSDEMLAKKVYDLKLLPKELNNLYKVDWDFIKWDKVGDYLIASEDWDLISIDFTFRTYYIAIKIDYDKISTNKHIEKYNVKDDDKINDYYIEVQKGLDKVIIYRNGDYYINIWNEKKGYKLKDFKKCRNEVLENWLKVDVEREFEDTNNFKVIELYILEQCEELFQYRELYINEYQCQCNEDDLPF